MPTHLNQPPNGHGQTDDAHQHHDLSEVCPPPLGDHPKADGKKQQIDEDGTSPEDRRTRVVRHEADASAEHVRGLRLAHRQDRAPSAARECVSDLRGDGHIPMVTS